MLNRHQKSERHINVFVDCSHFKKYIEFTAVAIENILSKKRSSEVEQNREHVKPLFRTTRFLGKQGPTFRGNDESSGSNNRGNVVELLSTFVEKDKNGHCTSHEYQNDHISVSGKKIIRHISYELEGKFLAILADETKDMPKKEQKGL